MVKRFLKALGLILLQFILVIPGCWNDKTERVSKSSDQYWFETGLGSAELEGLLADTNCYLEKRGFLACVNAVSSMAERYNRILGTDGKFVPISTENIDLASSEKRQLKAWEKIYILQSENPEISFLEKWKELDQNFIRPSERSAVIALGINSFLSVAKDPHTYLLPIAQYEEVISNSEAKQDKIGFIFRKNGNKVLVKKVYDGSPADLAGLKKSDVILEINGQKTDTLLAVQISDVMRVRNGERLGLLVARKGQTKYLEIIKSDSVYPSVSSKILPGNAKLGLLMIHKFTKDSCEAARTKMVGLMEEGIRGLLVDVRDNPGGQLDQAACIINLFVPRGTTLFQTKYLDPVRTGDTYVAENEQVYSGNMAVLINSGSASASEILAGSLKDLGRATLVGERSFGKGSFQDGHMWGANQKIALFQTEGLYYFPSGWTPQLVGLQPDVPVAFNNTEQQQESELYYNPIKPKDAWTGPQTLAWLQQFECESKKMAGLGLGDHAPSTDDLQIEGAAGWLACRSQDANTKSSQAEIKQ